MSRTALPLLPLNDSRRPSHLPVNEVFWDVVQGEGPYMGRASAFIRLGYCNLHCPPCDTKPTWDTSQYVLERDLPAHRGRRGGRPASARGPHGRDLGR